MTAEEIMSKVTDLFDKYGYMPWPVFVNKTVDASPVDRELEKAIRKLAAERGLKVAFTTKAHKTTRIHGYNRISGRAETSSYVTKIRTLLAFKAH